MPLTQHQLNEAFQRAQANEPPPPNPTQASFGPDEPIQMVHSRVLPGESDIEGWTERVKEVLAEKVLNWRQAIIGQFSNYQGTCGATRYDTWGRRAKEAHEKAYKARLSDEANIRAWVSFALQCLRAWSPATLTRLIIVKCGEQALNDILPEFTAKFEKPDPSEAPRFTEGVPQPEESAKVHKALREGTFGRKPVAPPKILSGAKLDAKIEEAIKAAQSEKPE